MVRFQVRRLLRMIHPPLVIFIILVLGSCLAGYVIIYSTLALHQSTNREGYLRLETECLKTEFPRNWFAMKWAEKNETVGNVYITMLASTRSSVAVLFRILDETAMQAFMSKNNLKDISSITVFEAHRMYEWSRENNNNNATLFLNESGTITISGNKAYYTKIIILDGGKKDGTLYNLTSMFISYVTQQKLAQITFWGEEEDWNKSQETFEIILNSTKIRE